MFLNILHITAHLSMKEWKNCMVKILRWSKSSHSSSTMLVRLTQIISTSSEHKKIKRHTSWHLRLFITTHPTSCVCLHRETLTSGTEKNTQNQINTQWQRWGPVGMGSIQCKCAAWSIIKTFCSASVQPSTGSNKHLKNVSHKPGLLLPWQLINLKRRMKNYVLCLQRCTYKLMLQLHPQKGLEVSKISSPNVFGIYL